jgi:SAM-dependent methyltransferase
MQYEKWKQEWKWHLNEDNQIRVQKFVDMIPSDVNSILEVGARTGCMTSLMCEYHSNITALDLTRPTLDYPGVHTVSGDATNLHFPDDAFDVVVCSQVLEHIPPYLLFKACSELARVAKKYVIIGVPYKQDIRWGRLTCQHCGTINPPYGHVNSFDLEKIEQCFANLTPIKVETLGPRSERTKFISTKLMDWSGNPYGTYEQLEECIQCGKKIIPSVNYGLSMRLSARVAMLINSLQNKIFPGAPWWVHVIFTKSQPD